MADLSIASWRPDQAPLGDYSRRINNVARRVASALNPLQALAPITEALTLRCQGAASFRATDGTVRTFAWDADDAYYQDPSDATQWINATRAMGGDYTTADDDFVNAVAYGDLAISVNGADAAQKFDITSDTEFSALGGSPPLSHDIAVWDDYLVLAEVDPNNRIHWSATDNPEGWTAGTGNSDTRQFGDGGAIVRLTGGRQKLVMQENMIRRATNVGGTDIFQLNVISTERGCAAKQSVATYQDLVFFLADDGIFMISDGGLKPIGQQICDDEFWRTVNRTYLHRCVGICSPRQKLYLLAYPTLDSADGVCDRVLIYNWAIDEWTPADGYRIEYLRRVLTGTGITLEALDTLYPSGLESIPFSFDSPAFASTPEQALAGFDSAHKMGYFDGMNLAATIASLKGQFNPGFKSKIQAVRAICDGGLTGEHTATVAVHNDKLNDAERVTASVTQRETGRFPFAAKRTKGRYHAIQHDIAAGADWSNFQGWNVDAVRAGKR
jgi:hypothetical protein